MYNALLNYNTSQCLEDSQMIDVLTKWDYPLFIGTQETWETLWMLQKFSTTLKYFTIL